MKPRLALLLILLSAGGCVRYMPAGISSTSIGTKNEVPVKVTSGESSAVYVFFLGPFGNDSLEAAIENAKGKAQADSIANVFVDRKLTCYPFYPLCLITFIDTRVYGTLVKYKTDAGEELEPMPGFTRDSSEQTIPATTEKVPEPEILYGYLMANYLESPAAASRYYLGLRYQAKNIVRNYILEKKGKASSWNWRFKIDRALADDQKSLVEWFLKTYTDYKSLPNAAVQSPE